MQKNSPDSHPDLNIQRPSPWCDREFDMVYPDWIQKLSDCHWTPVDVARKAARFLVTGPGKRILDVGCGPGKFCAVGAATTDGHFTGIEQRSSLASIARQTMQDLGLSNKVRIIHANVTEADFRDYDAFYFFNPFYENVFPVQCIDSTVELDQQLYAFYTGYVRNQLALAPLGTRVVTFHGDGDKIPPSYECQGRAFDGCLKLWSKSEMEPLHGAADQGLDQENELQGAAAHALEMAMVAARTRMSASF